MTPLFFFQFIANLEQSIGKPDTKRIAFKTYVLINSNLLYYKNWKQK